ncbi:phospholipid carrier-dependent glycosyltransferase [Candidatus Microgenomates bacterium]|nr:MAG: phospholipid carrier-dependent glycosyltransferase [Candidatus Microgenomates bacterium]
MKNKKYLFLFLIIIFFAAFLRLYRISDVPPGVNRDEASIGYTAYSLIKTGADEYGIKFPLSFQSFGDWKLPFYIYVTAISVKIFGLSEFAVRFPSALFGIATVGLTFFLVKKLFNNNILSFLSMALMAISPWHLHLSRVGSEANSAVFLIVLGLFFFLISLKEKCWLITLSFLLFALSYYAYAGNHIFTTIFIIGLIYFYRKKIPKTKWFYASILLFTVLSGFIFYQTFFIADKTKLSGVSIFSDPSLQFVEIETLRNEHDNTFIAKAFHNPIILGLERFMQNYLNSFSPDFLFFKGGTNNAHNIDGFGNMYVIESLSLLFGLVYLFTSKKNKEVKLILFWFFISPLAVSITKDAPHSTRMFAIFPILPLIVAFGIYYLFNQIKNTKIKNLLIIIVIFAFALNFIKYLDLYYLHFPKNEAASWGTGYKKLVSILNNPKISDKKIVVSYPETSPYIFMLFYSKYSPEKYQKNAVRYNPTSEGFIHVKQFDKYEFRHIDWSGEIKKTDRILVDVPLNVSDFTKKQNFPTENVILPNGEIMFKVVEITEKANFNY